MRIRDWSSDVCSSDGSLKPVLAVASPRVGVVRTHNGGSPGRACPRAGGGRPGGRPCGGLRARIIETSPARQLNTPARAIIALWTDTNRTEEPKSELQSLMRTSDAVFCLHNK